MPVAVQNNAIFILCSKTKDTISKETHEGKIHKADVVLEREHNLPRGRS